MPDCIPNRTCLQTRREVLFSPEPYLRVSANLFSGFISFSFAFASFLQEKYEMSKNRITKTIGFEPEIFAELEKQRGNKQHHRSPFVNDVLRKELGLEKKELKKE